MPIAPSVDSPLTEPHPESGNHDYAEISADNSMAEAAHLRVLARLPRLSYGQTVAEFRRPTARKLNTTGRQRATPHSEDQPLPQSPQTAVSAVDPPAGQVDAHPGDAAPTASTTPASKFEQLVHAVGRVDEPHPDTEFSTLICQAQAMIRPLARIIVLIVLLAAAGLTYLVLENRHVPSSRPAAPDSPHFPEGTAALTGDSPAIHRAATITQEQRGSWPLHRQPLENIALGPAQAYQPTRPDADLPHQFSPVPLASQTATQEIWSADQQEADDSNETPADKTASDGPILAQESPSRSNFDTSGTPVFPTTGFPAVDIEALVQPSRQPLREPERGTAVAEFEGTIVPVTTVK